MLNLLEVIRREKRNKTRQTKTTKKKLQEGESMSPLNSNKFGHVVSMSAHRMSGAVLPFLLQL